MYPPLAYLPYLSQWQPLGAEAIVVSLGVACMLGFARVFSRVIMTTPPGDFVYLSV